MKIGAGWSVPALEHFRELAKTFGEFESRWSHLKREELGDDYFHSCGLPRPLIDATTELYGDGRDLAMGLAADFANVTNPARFPDISHFIRHVEQHIPRCIPELEVVVGQCETELAAVPVDFDFPGVFAQRQVQWGIRALSPWHLMSTIRDMIGLFRYQLTLLDTVSKDIAVLKRAQSAADDSLPAGLDQQPALQYAFYLDGEFWDIAFEGQRTRLRDRDGFRYIAYLLARPNQEVGIMTLRQLGSKQHAPDLEEFTVGDDGDKAERHGMVASDEDRDDFRAHGDHEQAERHNRARSEEVIDPTAIDQARKAYADLDQQLATARDEDARERIQTQLKALRAYLGNSRARFPSPLKNAQSTVRKRIIKARDLIGRHIPALERHLGRIKTGYTCSYRPDREIPWQLEPSRQQNRRRAKNRPAA